MLPYYLRRNRKGSLSTVIDFSYTGRLNHRVNGAWLDILMWITIDTAGRILCAHTVCEVNGKASDSEIRKSRDRTSRSSQNFCLRTFSIGWAGAFFCHYWTVFPFSPICPVNCRRPVPPHLYSETRSKCGKYTYRCALTGLEEPHIREYDYSPSKR